MKKTFLSIILFFICLAVPAENSAVHFYWHHVQLEASAGGYIYATGDWRLPLSDEDFGTSITTKWVIAGTNDTSSCYAWALPEEGYYFAGWYGQNGTQLLTTDTAEARIWSTTTVAVNEDGIVSGNNCYSMDPSDTIRAVFLPLNATSLPQATQAEQDEQSFDILGRLIRTSEHGQIYIKGGKKRLRL